MNIHIHTCIHTYMHAYIHTYIRTHTSILPVRMADRLTWWSR